MAAASDPKKESPSGRSFQDFAHLFLSRAPAPTAAEGVAARPPSAPPPARLDPQDPPQAPSGPDPRIVAFLDDGEGWLRSFLVAELALLLGRELGRVRVCEEGGLFPTVSSHLGRVLGRSGGARSLSIVQGEPTESAAHGVDLLLIEVPAWLPPWARPWLARADLTVLVAGKGHMHRLRAFHQWKRLSGNEREGLAGLILAEAPGSGQARLAFHRFLSAAPQRTDSDLLFLGALPQEPALERIILPERKPAQVYFPGSLTTAALISLAAAIRRVLSPEPVGP